MSQNLERFEILRIEGVHAAHRFREGGPFVRSLSIRVLLGAECHARKPARSFLSLSAFMQYMVDEQRMLIDPGDDAKSSRKSVEFHDRTSFRMTGPPSFPTSGDSVLGDVWGKYASKYLFLTFSKSAPRMMGSFFKEGSRTLPIIDWSEKGTYPREFVERISWTLC
jgi:hypothetical protein